MIKTSKVQNGGDENCLLEDEYSLCLTGTTISTRKILSIFVGRQNPLPEKLPPSLYLIELRRGQEERQALLKRNQMLEKYGNLKGELEIVPNTIVFQNWSVDKSYVVKFTVTNRLKNPLNIMVKCEPDSNFQFTSSSNSGHIKLVSGIATPFSVVFRPNRMKDHKHRLLIIMDKSQIVVPIIAVGPRPMLDFPDEIDFGEVPVKVTSERLLTLTNVGNLQATASLSLENPFDAFPNQIIAQPSSCCTLKVIFHSAHPGLFTGSMKISYDNGDETYVKLSSLASNMNVRLQKDVLDFGSNYVDTKTRDVIKLLNDTKYVLSFKWLRKSTLEEDMANVISMENIDADIQRETTHVGVDYYLDDLDHDVIINRVHTDSSKHLERDNNYFHHANFEIFPKHGEVNPHSSKEITVIFCPSSPIGYIADAFCDIQGANARFPLQLRGTGTGPNIISNIDVIDFDLIFLKLEHTYEVIFSNIGIIPGEVTFEEPQLIYGGFVTVSPDDLKLGPSEAKIMCIQFHSTSIGPFVEELYFNVKRSDKPIRILIKGKTVSPLLIFNRSYLEFGRIPFGFPISQTLRVQNKSQITATFYVIVPDDGEIPSRLVWSIGDRLTSFQCFKSNDNEKPQEFSITPSSGVLLPYGTIELEIMLTPNVSREHNTHLQFYLNDITHDELSVPIHFTACEAKLSANPSVIVNRYAFIDHPYEYDVTIENDVETPIFFYQYVQKAGSITGVMYSFQETNGIINGNSSACLKLIMTVTSLGKQEEPVRLNIFGVAEPIIICSIAATGIGPLVTVDQYCMSWTNQQIGDCESKELCLNNICPIPASWKLKLEMNNSGGDCNPQLWSLSEEEGYLKPGETILVEVTACFIDTKKIVASLYLDVENSNPTKIKLVGEGVGSSIVFEPPILEFWDFGDLFINEVSSVPILVKNIGTLHHRLMFTNTALNPLSNGSFKPMETFIEMEPNRIELEGCQSCEINALLFSCEVGTCSAECFVYATLNRKGKRKLIGRTIFKVNFILPLLAVDPPRIVMFFRLEKITLELPPYLSAEARVFTTSSIPVDATCTVDAPFTLVLNDGEENTFDFLRVTKEPTVLHIRLNLKKVIEEDVKQITGTLTYVVKNKYKTRVPIEAAILFPYATVSSTTAILGSCEPYSELNSTLHLKNKGNLSVEYQWKLVPESFKFYEMSAEELSQLCDEKIASKFEEKFAILPTWIANGNAYESIPENIVKVDSHQVFAYLGILVSLSGTRQGSNVPSGENDNAPKTENNILKLNTHAVVQALSPILSDWITLAFITNDKENMPLQPPKDGRAWDLDLVTSYGELPSKGEILINAFTIPERMGKFIGDVVCEVKEGLAETIHFIGSCGPTCYKIEPPIINFGSQKFCEIWRSRFKIFNTGCTSFYYEINVPYQDHLFEYCLRPGTFSIKPSSQLVEAGNEIEIELTLYPAFTGPIEKYFYLLVGSAPPLKVYIKGNAIVPLVVLNCPLEDALLIPEQIKYCAIGRHLCTDWYDPSYWNAHPLPEHVYDNEQEWICNVQSDHVCLERPPPAADEQTFLHSFENGWVLVTWKDFVPSDADITLAIHKELCRDYYLFVKAIMKQHSLCHDSITKQKSLPYFVVPGYKMDVGPVIIGSEVHYDLNVYNPGPIEANFRVKLPFKNKAYLAKKGITFEDVEETQLSQNKQITLKCDVRPSRKLYANIDADCSIEFTFFIEIGCGPKIPVRFTTVVTCPYLKMSKRIDFGIIKCGQKKKMEYLVKNSGCVTATWKCFQRPVKRKTNKVSYLLSVESEIESPFNISPLEGVLKPLSCQVLTIEFLPTIGGRFERILEFNILNREEPQSVRLIGSAMELKVDIYFENVDFDSTIPFARPKFKELTVVNNTSEPLEVFFPEFDYDIVEEEKIFSALCNYYGVENMFVPSWYYYTSMAPELKNIYYNKLGRLANEYYTASLDEKAKTYKKSRASTQVKTSRTVISEGASSGLTNAPKSTKSKKKKKGRTSTSTTTQEQPKKESAKKVEGSVTLSEPILAEPSLDEKISMYINHLNTHPELPRRDLFHPLDFDGYEKGRKEIGKLIFFGGGPNTDYHYWAKFLSEKSKLKYLTVDELILFSAVNYQSEAGSLLRKEVNNVYSRLVMGLDPKESEIPDQFEPSSEIEDPLLDLMTKIDAIEQAVDDYKEANRRAKAKQEVTKQVPKGGRRSKSSRKSSRRKSKRKQRSASKQSKRKSRQESRKSQSKKKGSQESKRRSSKKSQRNKKKKSGEGGRIKTGSIVSKYEKKREYPMRLLLDLDKPIFEDLPVQDLLEHSKDYLLKFIRDSGVVLDYMRGFFIRDSVLAMTSVMKIVNHHSIDMKCVDLHSSYAFYRTIVENCKEKEEMKQQINLNFEMDKLDILDGYGFREIGPSSKQFFMENSRMRDQQIRELAIDGVPILIKEEPAIPPSVSSTPGTPSTYKSNKDVLSAPSSKGTLNNQPISAPLTLDSQKSSTTAKTESYVSKLKVEPTFEISDDVDIWNQYVTYESEMKAIREILLNFDALNPFWLTRDSKKNESEPKKSRKSRDVGRGGSPNLSDKRMTIKDGAHKISSPKKKSLELPGIPYYVLHTIPKGLNKELNPMMNYLYTQEDFRGTPRLRKPWDQVEVTDPVTYFWIMAPIQPQPTTENEKGFLPIECDSEVFNINELTEELDVNEEEEALEACLEEEKFEIDYRRKEKADPLLVGVLSTSNQTNEKKSITQLREELARADRSLEGQFVNGVIVDLIRSSSTATDRSKSLSKTSPSKKLSRLSISRKRSNDLEYECSEILRPTACEYVESDQFHIVGVSLAPNGEYSGPGVRVFLKPGESAAWQVFCSTRKCGAFQRKFIMEIGGWPKSSTVINCHVVSGVPTINNEPDVLYPCVIEKYALHRFPAFIIETGSLNFGPIMSGKNQSDPKVFQKSAQVKIVNNSPVTIEEIDLFFFGEPSLDFSFEPEKIANLKAGEQKFLEVYAHPTESSETCRTTLAYAIKNNPKLEFFKLECQCISGNVSFKADRFVKIKTLLYRKIDRILTMTNAGFKVKWELKNADELRKVGIRFNRTKGNLLKGEEFEMELSYCPDKPGILAKTLKIEVYSWDLKGSPIQAESIPFVVDAVDIIIDVIYSWKLNNQDQLEMRDHLDCGQGGIGTVIPRTFIVHNKSLVDCNFQIEQKGKLPCEIEFIPVKAVLGADKKVIVEVNVSILVPLKLVKKEALDLIITAGSTFDNEVVAVIPIALSVFCPKSKFSIIPSNELDFGVVEVYSHNEQSITFENTGQFPMDIILMTRRQLVLLMEQIREADKEERQKKMALSEKSKSKSRSRKSKSTNRSRGTSTSGSRKSSRRASRKSSRRKSRRSSKRLSRKQSHKGKKKGSRNENARSKSRSRSSRALQDRMIYVDRLPLDFGPFKVSTKSVTIAPQSQETVSVTCNITVPQSLEETLIICSSDIVRDHPEKGIAYTVRALGVMPLVDFNSPQCLYPDMMIVDEDTIESIEDYNDFAEGEPNAVYFKNSKQIKFFNVPLGQKVFKSILLDNVGFIDAIVRVWVEETPNDMNPELSFGLSDDLTMKDTNVYIPKFNHAILKIFFCPTVLERVTAELNFSLVTTIPNYNLEHSVNLTGTGELPEITFVKPIISENVRGFINFGNSPLESDNVSSIIFRNSGSLACTVLMEIGEEVEKNEFKLKVTDVVKENYVKSGLLNDNVCFGTTTFRIPRNGEVEILAVFRPATASRLYRAFVIFHVLYNPYVITTLTLCGSGSTDWLCLQGLPLLVHKEPEIRSKGQSKQSRRASSASRKRESGFPQDESFGQFELASRSSMQLFVGRPTNAHVIDFNFVTVGTVKHRNFELLNASSEPCRFEWDQHEIVRIIPRMGHILPKMIKQCYATFMSEEIALIDSETLVCTAYPIVYDEMQTVQWDTEKKIVQWINGLDRNAIILSEELLSKAEFQYPEPTHKKGTGPEVKLNLIVRGEAVVPQVNLSAQSINFNTAFLYQKEETSLEVRNESQHPVTFTWEVLTKDVQPVTELFSEHPVISTGPLGDGQYPCITNSSISVPKTPAQSNQQMNRSGYLYAPSTLPEALSTGQIIPKNSCNTIENLPGDHKFTTIYDFVDSYASLPFAFVVTPDQGTIFPKETMTCKITFVPSQPLNYIGEAKLKIEGQTAEGRSVLLFGIGQISSCHLEVAPSDYLTAGRRNLKNVDPYDYDLKTTVIEIQSVGDGVICRKRFMIMNPTDFGYKYIWHLKHLCSDYEDESDTPKHSSPFICATKFGEISAKKRAEMLFEFRPKRFGTVEALWILEVPELNLHHPVLLVGIAAEAKVMMKPNDISLRPTLTGVLTSGVFTIENKEAIALPFVIETQCHCPRFAGGLEIIPSEGTLEPLENLTVRVNYLPNSPGENTFLVKCLVKRKSEPLQIKVNTVCYRAEVLVKYRYKSETHILDAFQTTQIDLGRINERIPCKVEFILTNSGIPPWYFNCEMDETVNSAQNLNLILPVCSGLVLGDNSTEILLTITPLKKSSFHDIPFAIKISKGPEYNISFTGTAALPEYKFSFHEFDFGPKLILETYETLAYQANLYIANLDDEPIVLEKTSIDPDYLQVGVESFIINPRSRKKVAVRFMPQIPGLMTANLRFVVNNIQEEIVCISGEGVEENIQLKTGKDEFINLGVVEMKKAAEREIKIVNWSKCKASIRFFITPGDGFGAFIKPPTIELEPKQTGKLYVVITPTARGIVYNGEVKCRVGSKIKTLLTVSCTGGGYNISLNRDRIRFPAVTIGNRVVDRICLNNQGEYSARFEWNIEDPMGRELFTIFPQSGTSSLGSSIPIEVSFYPMKLFKNMRKEAACKLSNGQILKLALSGACTELPPTEEVIEFSVPVRKKIIKTITLDNKTHSPWRLFPIVSGMYFSGADRIDVVPNQVVQYEVEYHPMRSTTISKHSGSVFFSLIDGKSKLYTLIGETQAPEEEDIIMWHIVAKDQLTRGIEVRNWLDEPQRFKVSFIWKEGGDQETIIIESPGFIDLSSYSSKIFEVSVFAFKRGISNWKVEMVNEAINEVLIYNLQIDVDEDKILERFTLDTTLRVPIVKVLRLYNPLTRPAELNFQSPTATLKILSELPFTMSPASWSALPLEFLPQFSPDKSQDSDIAEEEEDMETVTEKYILELRSPQLGSFYFEATLITRPALPEPTIHLETQISCPIVFLITIQLVSLPKTTFEFHSNFDDISLQDQEIKRSSTKKTLLAKCVYAPTQIGQFNCQLIFHSEANGTYTFPVVAVGLKPKPLGPILFETGQSKNITFRNVFREMQTFFVKRSNEAFEVDSNLFSLDPDEGIECLWDTEFKAYKNNVDWRLFPVSKKRRERTLTVTMVWARNQFSEEEVIEPYPIATQLTIKPDQPSRPGVQWTFYLKGRNQDVSETELLESESLPPFPHPSFTAVNKDKR